MKMVRSNFRFLVMAVLIGAFTLGCSSIVKKPEINGVRKVAIVSIYADGTIPWTGGSGRVEHFDHETRNRIALQAYKTFVNEFKRVKWDVISMDHVTGNSYYKK